MGEHGGQASRSAGTCLVVAGTMFGVVVTYLYAVLVPLGLDLAMFDEADRLLDWVSSHMSAYLLLYLLYAIQQVSLLAAPVLLWRYLPAVRGGGSWVRSFAATSAVLSIGSALLSSVLLIMSTHTAVQYWHLTSTPTGPERMVVAMMFDSGADLAKGARLMSEPLLGIWLVWIGWVLIGEDASRRSRAWSAVCVVGVWTAVVGVWKLMDPRMPYEDWVAFPIAAAMIAAGVALRRATADLATTGSP